MVAFNTILATLAATALVSADFTPPFTQPDASVTAAFMDPPVGSYDGHQKRAYPIEVRADVDPYAGWSCPNVIGGPSNPTCTRNNCFR